MSEFGTLFVIATPIGNLADITLRGLDTFRAVKVLYAEDTRVTQRLLEHYGIQATLESLHDFNESKKISQVIEHLQSGDDVGLVSDAGTPLISDPGYKLINAVLETGLMVRSIPGASALTASLSIAGLPTDRFIFEGFLPKSKSERSKLFSALRNERRTLVFYESPKRILSSIKICAEILGGTRKAALLREITKLYEEHISATLDEIAEQLEQQKDKIRGEMVFILQGNQAPIHSTETEKAIELLTELQQHMSLKQAVSLVSKFTGMRRNQLYSIGLQDRSNNETE